MKEIITGIFIGDNKDYEENYKDFILCVNCDGEIKPNCLNIKLLQKDNRGFIRAYMDNEKLIMEKWRKGNILFFCQTGIHKSCEFSCVIISKIFNFSIKESIKLICSKKENAFEKYYNQIVLWYIDAIKHIYNQD